MEASWLLALIVVPLFFNFDSYRIFEFDKIALLRSIMLLALAAWVGKSVSLGQWSFTFNSFKNSIKKALQIPLAAPIGALALAILISTVFSLSPILSIQGSPNRSEGVYTLFSYIFLFVLIAANLRRREQLERLVATLAAVSFAVDIYAILQHFGLDPLIWQYDVTSRAISTIGHFIFAAAFLSMTIFVMLGRAILAFQSFLNAGSSRFTDLIRAILYSLISILNLVAIWYTVSRGPLIGLFFGLGLFILLFLLYKNMRRALYAVFALGAVFTVFLVLLNLPNSPIASFRNSPLVGPLGKLFEAEGGTGRARVLIWQGMSRLTAPHTPMQFPDHSQDRWNPIRPLVGYGPETLLLGYEGYYNPKSYVLESRNVQYDHAHNEFWDTLYSYGILGLVAEYAFFLSIFYYGLCWLTLITNSKERKLYWGLALGGGLLGILIPLLSGIPEFIGLGCPLGLLAGLAGIAILRTFHPNSDVKTHLAPWQVISLISILAAIISHYVEILFGISMITSRLLLWSFSGLFLFIGWVAPTRAETSAEMAAHEALPRVPHKKTARSSRPAVDASPLLSDELHQIGVNAGLLSLIMVTLGAGFLTTLRVANDAGTTLTNALTSIPLPAPHPSYGILGMFMGVLLVSALFLQLEADSTARRGPNWANLTMALGIALLISILAWMIRASQLVTIHQAIAQRDVAATSAGLLGLPTGYYITILLISLFLAFVLAHYSAGYSRPFSTKPLSFVGYAFSLSLALILPIFLNLRPMQANMLYLQVMKISNAQDYSSALKFYDQVMQLTPTDNDHLSYAAKLYVGAIRSVPNVAQKEQYFQTGLKYAQKAYAQEPFLVENTMALARINREGGEFTVNPTLKNARFSLANKYYTDALSIKPGRIDYWLEWAEFRALAGDIKGSIEKVNTALAIDKTYPPVYQFTGDLYFTYANSLNDQAARTEAFTKALQAYQQQAKLITEQRENAAGAIADVGKAYESLQQFQLAREAYLNAAALGLGNNQWQVLKKIAELSGDLKDAASQREYLQKAIQIAPEAEKSALQSELGALNP
jgi:tetratricopeptide (TPR) repeat protein